MSYMDIENLYKARDILQFKTCYAMEKIHGTSAHVSWKDGKVSFFAGGVSHEAFVKLFDEAVLRAGFEAVGHPEVVVFGEAYGGKCQGMRATYGDELRFVAFEVKIGDSWLCVPVAEEVARKLGFDFVHYEEIPTTVEAIDAARDADSVQAVKNGMGQGKMREGIVLRPPFEVRKNNGERVIAKHKRAEFAEVRTPRLLDEEQRAKLVEAEKITHEWVTPMRLSHVLDKIAPPPYDITLTGKVVSAMIDDVEREAAGEIEITPNTRKAIGRAAALLFKRKLAESLNESEAQ